MIIDSMIFNIVIYLFIIVIYRLLGSYSMEYYVYRYQPDLESIEIFFASIREPIRGSFVHEKQGIFTDRSNLHPIDYLLEEARKKSFRSTFSRWFWTLPILMALGLLIVAISRTYKEYFIYSVITFVFLVLHIYTLVRAWHFGHNLKSPM